MSNVSAKWRVYDDNGGRHQPPSPRECLGNYGCGSMSPVRPTERMAVMAWAVDREIAVVEIVAPFELSMREQCEKAIGDMWERVRLMGDAEGGNGTGGIVRFVIDDACGVEEQDWLPEQCDDALDGIALALSALHLMDEDQ